MTANIKSYRRTLTESEMTDAISDLVAIRHGRMWHCRNTSRSPELEDMPDLVILLPSNGVTPGLLAVAELKSPSRQLTRGQRQVAELMSSVTSVFCGVVRPEPKEDEFSYDDFLDVLRG